MKLKKYHLIFGVITGILCTTSLSEVELPPPKYDSLLVGRANSTLAGIERLNVTVIPTYAEPNEAGLVCEELQLNIVRKLGEADIPSCTTINGMSIFSYYVPNLRVYIDMIKLPDSQKCVFRIQTSLATKVYLTKDSAWFIEADVWKTGPTMQAVSVQNMPAKVTEVVLEQVEAFIQAHRIAHQPKKQVSEANDMAGVPVPAMKESSQQPVKEAVAEYKYVASKNGEVFHTPTCRSVKRISPENMMAYSTREEAINAGKRPCKLCTP